MLRSIAAACALAVLPGPAGLCAAQDNPDLDRPVLDGVDTVVREAMEAGHFPGAAVGVTRHGEAVHVGSYGLASIEHDAPVRRDTVFELASLTKHMTALLIMELAEEGALSTDDRVTEYLDRARPEWESITIDDLLAHMGGLAHRFEPRPYDEFLLEYSTDLMLDGALDTEMQAEPGEDWIYSDQGYFLLGLVIENVTGRPFDAVLEERWFGPLGMNVTGRLDQHAIIPRRAEGYAWKDGEIVRNRRVWQFGQMAHFGVVSSLDDMLAWEAELAAPSVTSPQAFLDTTDIRRAFDAGESCEAWGYAAGWMTFEFGGRQIVAHGGYSGTAYLRDLTTGLSVVVLTNREDAEGALSPVDIAWAVANAADPALPETGPRCWE
ncbi:MULTISPECIES: serine hydrolase domain-containing protein [Hyphobacterium]|uniref:Serine hydrolase domain-containing protein n=1 Tax=Hyphobacterium vulgare TaxID=1736751 RepID=A0ABV6ZZN1_9PROT